MSEHVKDVLVALGLIAVGAAALAIIATTEGEPTVVGAETLTFATLPSAYAICIIALSALLALNAAYGIFRNARPSNAGIAAATPRRDNDADALVASPRVVQLRTLLTLMLLIAYALLLEHLDFMLLTTLFLAVMFVVFGQRSPMRVALAALVGGASFYALFILALNLPV